MHATFPTAQPHRFTGWKIGGRERTVAALNDALCTRPLSLPLSGFERAGALLRRYLPMLPPDEVLALQQAALGRAGRRPLPLYQSGEITVALFTELDQDRPCVQPIPAPLMQPGQAVWVQCGAGWRDGVIERLYRTGRDRQCILVRGADGRSVSVAPTACFVALDQADSAS